MYKLGLELLFDMGKEIRKRVVGQKNQQDRQDTGI